MACLGSWTASPRIIPVSKWLVTPIYKPFRPFIRGITPVRGLTNHGGGFKDFFFSPQSLEKMNIDEPILTIIFFSDGLIETTN